MPKNRAELKEELDKSTVAFGDFNIPLLITDRKIDRESLKL